MGRELLDKLSPAQDACKEKKNLKSTGPTHTITNANKSDSTLLVTFKFYGCDDIKNIWVNAGETVSKQSPCQLKYIEVENFTRANKQSGFGSTREVYLSEGPALFQFHALKGKSTEWEYGKQGLIPTKGVQFIGKEKLDLLGKAE